MKLNRKVRQAVIERDRFCVLCGKVGVDIHHCVYKSLQGAESVENMVLLCRDCHSHCHSYGKEMFNVLFDILKTHYPNLTKEGMKR